MQVPKLFDGKSARMCMDQYGNVLYARSLKELRAQCGGSVSRMYSDFSAPPNIDITLHTGYVVGSRWFAVYAPLGVKQ